MDEPSAPSPASSVRATPVELRGIGRLFGPVRALAGVNLRLEPGELCLLVGPNGAGKSTLLRVLSTLLRPTVGELRYGGRTVVDAGRELRAQIGFLAHRTQLHADLTGRETLELAAALHGADRAAVDRWSVRTGIAAFQNRPVRTYSRGQTQRVALARTFVGEPSLVLLDEPTTGLDPDAVRLLCDVLAERRRNGTTLVVATHDPQVFAGLDPHTVRIVDGRASAAPPAAGAPA
jgi:ABC-type multidrug transport system ATPase subunit